MISILQIELHYVFDFREYLSDTNNHIGLSATGEIGIIDMFCTK